ncbi:MAG: RNA 2',3'-cyclic phosphodiesterase [Pseudomonadota bacterium]
MLHRLFAALPVPPEIADPLLDLQVNLPGASWRPIENFHITLRFFGELDHPTAKALDAELAAVRAKPIELEINGVGWFGRREPRAVWARIAPSDGLDRLAGSCERAARRLGLPPDKTRYIPHITLAYCHHTPLDAAQSWCDSHGAHASGPFWADRFHLYESRLGRGPSRYTAEAEYPLW